MSLCLAAGTLVISLSASEITLRWRHSVQKTLWEEVWRETPTGLVIDEARVEGSGAGMDPPEGALLRDGFWRWRPTIPPQRKVVMRRSGATADWQVCIAGKCQAMSELAPHEADPIALTVCPS